MRQDDFDNVWRDSELVVHDGRADPAKIVQVPGGYVRGTLVEESLVVGPTLKPVPVPAEDMGTAITLARCQDG